MSNKAVTETTEQTYGQFLMEQFGIQAQPETSVSEFVSNHKARQESRRVDMREDNRIFAASFR